MPVRVLVCAVVPTVYSANEPYLTWKGIGMGGPFCHTETNGVPAFISIPLAAKGGVR